MKRTALILIVTILATTVCRSQQEVLFSDSESVLDFYSRYSSYTDPGEYEYLYGNLPESLPELCSLIKSQFIHPYAERDKYSQIIPKERWNESYKYPTVESILKGLVSYNSASLVNNRKPEERPVVICRGNAILLASILKYRGIPVRVRAGYAKYIMPNFNVSHAICEVWNKNENRWMLVDPSMNMVDFSKDKFYFGNEAWQQTQQKELDPEQCGLPGKYTGKSSILALFNTDIAGVLGVEHTIYQYAPILEYAIRNNHQLSSEQVEILDRVGGLMNTLHANNLTELQKVYNSTPEIQLTKTRKIQINKTKTVQFTNEQSVLDFYRQYSAYTDPGEYGFLYKNLPDSLPELCRLIQSQFLHIVAEYPSYKHILTNDRRFDINKYTTIESILEGLLNYDSTGLTLNRKPEDKLVLGCQNYALMLASILKYKGVPARVRYGHATYLIPEFHTSHVICEVWNTNEKRWMLVDPNLNKVDFNRNEFDISNEAWIQMQKNEVDPKEFGFPGKYSGLGSIAGKLSGDLASVLGTEYPLNMYPPMMEYYFKNEKQLPDELVGILDSISNLMQSLNAENLAKLQKIYSSTPDIKVTKTRKLKYLTEDNSKTVETPKEKPNIEFIDIPGGTFIMGSPVTESGRKDNELQHEVTLSSFKMSKYTITVEQYNQFCIATGRRKPFYGPYGKAKNSVTQVNWHDAQAFAEWMGCRLPTEAEWEYAARANTTTPFYTGDCLTTDQANFNGSEPYMHCEKGINRKKPIAVGSFSPNAFGLYDMHGNMLEWCSDWYGEYNIDDNTNPKGPETGDIKIFRGGGYWLPAERSRSASRSGDPQGNRGAGISFRLVKDN